MHAQERLTAAAAAAAGTAATTAPGAGRAASAPLSRSSSISATCPARAAACSADQPESSHHTCSRANRNGYLINESPWLQFTSECQRF
jgi:hypothetical protein